MVALGSLPGAWFFRARSASMRVVGGRIDVYDGVGAPTFSAISAVCVPGRDGLVARGTAPMAKVAHICRMVAHAVALIEA